MKAERIFLSPPHLTGNEQVYIQEAIASNWIAPLGPHVDAFEAEFAATVGAPFALALSSGTAAIHLALITSGIMPHDEVLVSDLTFSASVNPIRYCGARPTFIDSDRKSWNMDPLLLQKALSDRARLGRLPKAVLVVHLYGQSANMDPILEICARYGVTVIEDAAEALGATYHGQTPGTFGRCGTYSFNGNKIVTTSGGGMLVSSDEGLIAHARKLSTQARDQAPWYQHSEIGYNYRLSNILAALGRAQLAVLEDRVAARRRNFEHYVRRLADVPGISFAPEADWGRHTRWLTCITIDDREFGMDREQLRLILEAENIESRPIWKPMHLQPVFADFECIGGQVSEQIFASGLCLPSGSSLTSDDLERVVTIIRAAAEGRSTAR